MKRCTGKLLVLSLIAAFACASESLAQKVTIVESGDKTEVIEGGATDSYTVVLDALPTANVTVTLSFNTAELQTDKTVLTFTPANWSNPQTVTVTAVDDAVTEEIETFPISHTVSSSDSAYNGIFVRDVIVSIVDNDGIKAAVNIAESNNKTEVVEGGTGDSYTVVLSTQPAANVTVTLTVDTAQLGTDKTVLTFTPANWNSPQTVTVTAVNDATPEDLLIVPITHTATSSDADYNGLFVRQVLVSIIDDDSTKAAVSVAETGDNTGVTEGGAGDSYLVVLSTQPAANVTVTLSRDAAQLGTDKTVLTFTPANWNISQNVSVTAVDDHLDEGLHMSSITHAVASTDPDYNGIYVPEVVVTITDNDKSGVTITESGGSTEVTEGGSGDSYQVVLDTQPSANVVVTLTVPTTQLTTDKTTLTFTPANWNVAQTVTVNAVDDSLSEGNHVQSITHAVTSTDGNYNGLSVQSVLVSITDNDQSLVVSPIGVRVPEGSTATYTVKLGLQPAGNVSVTNTFASGDTSITVGGGAVLVFTSTNWDTPQTVTLAAAEDADVDNGTATITVSSGDLPSVTVYVSEQDNDASEVNVSVTVGTSPSGRSFMVDGTNYTSTTDFNWASGSSHTLVITSPQVSGIGVRHAWNNWSDGGAISHAVAPTSSTTYTANFTTQYYLTMNAGAGGSVTPSSEWYNSGANVGISAVANSEYVFSSWSGSGTGSYSGPNDPNSVTMNGPITEAANFTSTTTGYALGVSVEPLGSGSVAVSPSTASGKYAAGTVVTLTASPPAAWAQFGSWSGDLGGNSNPGTITMNADKSVIAHFVANADFPNSPVGDWEITVKGADKGTAYITYVDDWTWSGAGLRAGAYGLCELSGNWRYDSSGKKITVTGAGSEMVNSNHTWNANFTAKATAGKKITATVSADSGAVFKWSGTRATTYSDLSGFWSGRATSGRGSIPQDVSYRLLPISDYPGCFEVRESSLIGGPDALVGHAIVTSRNKLNAYLSIGRRECSLSGTYSPMKREIRFKGKDETGQPVSITVSR